MEEKEYKAIVQRSVKGAYSISILGLSEVKADVYRAFFNLDKDFQPVPDTQADTQTNKDGH